MSRGRGGGGVGSSRSTRASGIWWKLTRRLLLCAVGASLLITIIIFYTFTASTKQNEVGGVNTISSNHQQNQPPHQDKTNRRNDTLAVIVPFRDRFEELLAFAPHLHNFLRAQDIVFHIWIVNQVDSYRFNRASLINVGFLHATQTNPSITYMAMHDVDLLPLNHKLSYAHPGRGTAMHLAWLHPKYNYASFIGGILLLDVDDFRAVDGMSNVYWGWGLEDDEFWLRLKQNAIKVNRAEKGLGTGRKDTFRHIHSPKVRPRDSAKCFDQWAKTRKRDRVTGLHNVNYTLLSNVSLKIEDTSLTVLNVRLHCDKRLSPWCSCPPTKTPPTSQQNVTLNKPSQ